jgi:hypothetical protein
MTDELEVLARYMDEPEAFVDLAVAKQRLLGAIEEEIEHAARKPTGSLSQSRIRRRRYLVAMSALAAALIVALVLVTFPGGGQHGSSAAAATELHALADKAADQSTIILSQGNLLQSEERVSLVGEVTRVGSSLTPNARAIIDGTIISWADDADDACISATFGPAQFASSVNEAAWIAAGLMINPTSQPSKWCTPGDASPGGGGVINVTGLPANPSVLAHELQNGTTQIPQLDQLSGVQNAGFERAALLIIGPTVGDTPASRATLYNALADIPGINYLGTMAAHSGASGVGFAADTKVGRSILIVDPSTGSFIEAQNFQAPQDYAGIESSYVAPPPTPSITTQGGSGGAIIRWLDPVGTPMVVDASTLPPGLTISAPNSPPAQVTLTKLAGHTLITGAPKGYSNNSIYVQLCPTAAKFEPACQGQMTDGPIPVDGSYSLKVKPGSWNVGMYYWTNFGQTILGSPTKVNVQTGVTTYQSVRVAYQAPAASGVVSLVGAPRNFANVGYMGVQACSKSVQFGVGCVGGTEAYESVSPGSTYSLILAPGSWNIGAYYQPEPGVAGKAYAGAPTTIVTRPGELQKLNLTMTYQGP